MTYIPEPLRKQVAARAGGRCEYCRLHEDNSYYVHEIDHIYAEKHGGETAAENLCLACVYCNRHKGSDLCSLDPETGDVVSLFHPRHDDWHDHFRLNNVTGTIEPISAKARVTARVLQFNAPELILDRLRLIVLGEYQNQDDDIP